MAEESLTPRILVVDDEEEIRTILVNYLSEPPIECSGSANAFDALSRIRRERFELVITDILMPGMSGSELLRTIKKSDPDVQVVVISGLADLATAVECLRMGAFDYITKPFDLLTIRPLVQRALEHRRLMIENHFYQQELERKVIERTAELKDVFREIEESYRVTLEALVAALDAREHETQAHSQRVREYTLTLARSLGIADEAFVHVGRGALLHDVGKIGLPDSILLKKGPLTAEEWEEMKRHPRIGYDILSSIHFLAPAAEIVLAHQERWDGKGYPNKLAGQDIPLGARIFSVADTLDAMTSNRPYRKALSFQEAADEIRRCSGSQFDPRVVQAFLSFRTDTWARIHETVNRTHAAQADIAALCRISP